MLLLCLILIWYSRSKSGQKINIVNNFELNLNSIDKNDNYQEGLSANRLIVWSFSFNAIADLLRKRNTRNKSETRNSVIDVLNSRSGKKI